MREAVAVRRELARLEIQADLRSLSRLIAACAVAAVVGFAALPVAAVGAAEALAGCTTIPRVGWLLIFAGAFFAGAGLVAVFFAVAFFAAALRGAAGFLLLAADFFAGALPLRAGRPSRSARSSSASASVTDSGDVDLGMVALTLPQLT